MSQSSGLPSIRGLNPKKFVKKSLVSKKVCQGSKNRSQNHSTEKCLKMLSRLSSEVTVEEIPKHENEFHDTKKTSRR